jgi:predicted phage tail protein
MTDDIQGAGGGSGKGGGGSSHTPVEAPDSLHSIAHARVLDIISEGPILGFKHGAAGALKDIYFNKTPIQNADGSLNFKDVQIDSRVGLQVQDYIPGFNSTENEIADSVALIYGTPYSITLTHTYLSAARVLLSVAALSKADVKTGDIGSYTVAYQIELSTDGGSYSVVFSGSFAGKTTTKYTRSHRIDLPKATTSWTLRISRLTPTAASAAIADLTYVESHTEVIDGKFTYPNTALVGSTLDAQQFSNIPTRAFDVYGRIVRVPSNYNSTTRQYTGTWDGTFQPLWTNNPAWIYFDMATHPIYGLGDRIADAQVDKFALYAIAQYCDGYVPTGVAKRAAVTTGSVTLGATAPNVYTRTTGSFITDGFAVGDEINATGFAAAGNNGRGVVTVVAALSLTIDVDRVLTTATGLAGCTLVTQAPTEPRFTATGQLQVQGDAFKVMQDIASCFGGISYYAGGLITPAADMPQTPVYTYSNSNVIGGIFQYSGSSRTARHTVALVSWSDDSDFGASKIEYVFDDVGIARYGIVPISVTGFLCTSQSQAQRIGRKLLMTERLITNTVSFSVGLDGTFVLPGKVVRIADTSRAGRRMGGRLSAGGTSVGPTRVTEDGQTRVTEDGQIRVAEPIVDLTSVTIDAMPAVAIVAGNTFYATMPDGTVQTRTVASVSGNTITVTVAFTVAPLSQAQWAVETGSLATQLFRILSVTENAADKNFAITAIQYNNSLYSAVDNGTKIDTPIITAFAPGFVLAPTALALTTYQRLVQNVPQACITAEWTAPANALSYLIQFRRNSGDWSAPQPVKGTLFTLFDVAAGSWYARVAATGTAGTSSPFITSSALTVTDALSAVNILTVATGVVTLDARYKQSMYTNSVNTTLAFSNVPSATKIDLQLVSGGAFTFMHPANCKPLTGTPYVASTASGVVDSLTYTTNDFGVSWTYTYVNGVAFIATASPNPASATNTVASGSTTPSVAVTVSTTGGTAPVTYAWTRVDTAGGTDFTIAGGTTATATFSRTGSATLSLTQTWNCKTTDNVGKVTSVNVPITLAIVITGTGTLTAADVSASGTTTPGVSVTCSGSSTALATFGTGPYTYGWTYVSGGTFSTSGTATATATFSKTGTLLDVIGIWKVTATDSLSAVQTKNINVEVYIDDGSGGACVAVDQWLLCGIRAGSINVGDVIDICDHSDLSTQRRFVKGTNIVEQMCMRLTTISGAAVVASESTPMTLRDGTTAYFPDMLGKEVAVLRDGIADWETVVTLVAVGALPVNKIRVDNQCYWAGEQQGVYISTHNPLKP